MTTANKPLEARAGLNIGIEPDVGQFIQDCGGKERTLNTTIGASNVILECPERTARTPIPLTGEAEGMIFNTTAAIFYYLTFFRDEVGNEVPLMDPLTPASVPAQVLNLPGVVPFEVHDGRLGETGFCLTPGQKIILRPVAAPAPPV